MTDNQRKAYFKNQILPLCGITSDEYVLLEERGYFTAPSSINHHGNYLGGNFDHSYEVTKVLLDLTDKGVITWHHPRSPYIVGMFHDLCKIDERIKTGTGDLTDYEYNEHTYLTGHGEKSVMLLSQFMKLTEEEIFCIRYHMGAFKTDEWEHYGKAIQKYPNVLWTHTADMYATRVKGI